MEFRRLGDSGLSISEITYGNWLTHASQIEEEQAKACVNAAIEVGISTFDTADVYAGTGAEEVLGRALAGQRREGLEIFTKCFFPVGEGPNDRGLGRKHVMEACHGSLRRLGVEYVDLYQAHRFDRSTPLEETMLAFADLVRQGKVLYVGVSEWTAEQISRGAVLARELGVPLVSNQPQYSMLWRVIEDAVVPASVREGMGQIVWSPIAQGVLSGKYYPGQQPAEHTRGGDAEHSSTMGRFLRDEVLERVQLLKPVAADYQLTLPQLAVAWVLAQRGVSSAIIGASRPEQVLENAKASGVTLEADALQRIDEILGDVVQRDPSLTRSP